MPLILFDEFPIIEMQFNEFLRNLLLERGYHSLLDGVDLLRRAKVVQTGPGDRHEFRPRQGVEQSPRRVQHVSYLFPGGNVVRELRVVPRAARVVHLRAIHKRF